MYTEPKIIKETASGYSLVALNDEMFERRELRIFGEINEGMANEVTTQIRYLTRSDPNAEITLFINSPGGEVNSVMAIYDAMRLTSAPVRTVCTGVAASMASLLFAAGDTRDIYPHGHVGARSDSDEARPVLGNSRAERPRLAYRSHAGNARAGGSEPRVGEANFFAPCIPRREGGEIAG